MSTFCAQENHTWWSCYRGLWWAPSLKEYSISRGAPLMLPGLSFLSVLSALLVDLFIHWLYPRTCSLETENPYFYPPMHSLEGLMLKLQCSSHLMRIANSLEKTLMLGKIEGRRKRWWQRMRWLNGVFNSMDMNLSKLLKMGKNREAWWTVVHGLAKSQTWLSEWTTPIFADGFFTTEPPA